VLARVAVWEGQSPEAMREGAAMINASEGPPPGVPSVGITVLNDPANGRSVMIALFETDEDLRAGDAALRAMDRPPIDGLGDIASIDVYEVAVDRRV